ncbi:MAG: AGE family epimerase/isomerase [Pirellulaceae bacterium]|nr:AGE family epimerase/isomerase [Pirellulaceae bacterium]
MTPNRCTSLLNTYREGLLNDTVPFWIRTAVDRQHGGFITSLDRDGSVIDTDKGMWQQGRFTWLLAHLYNQVEARPEWLELATHGIDFIRQHGFDADGRMWFHLTREGAPLRKRRYAFTEAFTIMAFAEYARATNDDRMAENAIQLFERYQAFRQQPTGPNKFEPTRPMKSMGGPMITLSICQVLRAAIDWPQANRFIDQSIDEIEQDFVKPDREVVMESVGPEGQIYDHFDGRTLNPGHAIEGAWFIMHEGKHRADPQLIQLGTQMLEWMWHRGWDEEYGGMFYFRDLRGLPVQEYWHDMKFWWPHNETIIATLLAWSLTGQARYADWHRQIHDWAYQHFPDEVHGEWYGYLHRDGRISVPLKGNLWKGPFHLPRMQLYCWKLLEEKLSSEVT